MRRTSAFLVAGALLAGACGSSVKPPIPPVSGQPSPSFAVTKTATPTRAPSLTASPSPIAAGNWTDAGTMAIGRGTLHAILVGNSSVLVVGNDEPGCVRVDTAMTEIWNPSTNAWATGAVLNSLRGDFAAVPLASGRALVAGGFNTGGAISSTYVYDPLGNPAIWTKSGDLGTARVAPAAAALLDGRVLVAGGVYDGGGGNAMDPEGNATLAAFHLQPSSGGSMSSRLADVVPPRAVPVLATAELYDPATGTWSRSGSLRYARLGATAVTLADGRVLVVGSTRGGDWNGTRPSVPARAFVSAEIYDPATGRFSMVADLPPTDWSPISDLDPREGSSMWTVDPGRTLVALADGGALLFDKAVEWYGNDNMEGRIVRTLRFDPVAGSWAVIDVRVWQHKATGEPPAPMVDVVAGHSRSEPLVARLSDGRILVAGGVDGATTRPSAEADLYDAATNTWTPLPLLREPRAGGAAVALPDGSALLVGGDGMFNHCPLVAADCECGEGTMGLASAVRFVPGP